MSRRSRAAALAGLSLTLLAATGCAHSGVEVRVPEANNTDLPRDGVVHYNYPHVSASAPAASSTPAASSEVTAAAQPAAGGAGAAGAGSAGRRSSTGS